MTYWMKTDDVSLKGKDIWRAIWEYKTENYDCLYGHRY